MTALYHARALRSKNKTTDANDAPPAAIPVLARNPPDLSVDMGSRLATDSCSEPILLTTNCESTHVTSAR